MRERGSQADGRGHAKSICREQHWYGLGGTKVALCVLRRKQCGPVIAFAITFGLAVGSILAVVLMSLLQQS